MSEEFINWEERCREYCLHLKPEPLPKPKIRYKVFALMCMLIFALMAWAFWINPQPYGVYGLLWPLVAWQLWRME